MVDESTKASDPFADPHLLRRRVHQLEQELARSTSALHTVQENYRDFVEMVDRIGDIFFAIDRNWCYRYINPYAAQNVGMDAGDLIGKSLWETFPGLLGTAYEDAYRRAMEEQTLERFVAPGVISGRWYETTVYPSKHGLSIYGRDVTARKQAEDALRESEEWLRLASQTAGFGMYNFDAIKERIHWTPELKAIVGLSAEAPIPVDADFLPTLIHPDDHERVRRKDEAAFSPDGSGDFEDEHRIVRPDGETRWVLVKGKTIFEGEGEDRRPARSTGIVLDITERKTSEQQLAKELAERNQLTQQLQEERAQLRELTETLEARVQERTQQVRNLAAKLSLAEHQERERVAQILHDHVQQMLYAVQWRTHLLALDTPPDKLASLHANLQEMESLVKEAIAATRTLTVELSPPVLENEGLPEAVSWLANQVKAIHNLQISIQVQGDCSVPDKHLRILVFQIVRELLFNVVKHAGVDRARVAMRKIGNLLTVSVEDQGHGFPIAVNGASVPETSFGLYSIRERLVLFEGTLHIHSKPGEGTRVIFFVPMCKGVTPHPNLDGE